jgi:hypothetical protein
MIAPSSEELGDGEKNTLWSSVWLKLARLQMVNLEPALLVHPQFRQTKTPAKAGAEFHVTVPHPAAPRGWEQAPGYLCARLPYPRSEPQLTQPRHVGQNGSLLGPVFGHAV